MGFSTFVEIDHDRAHRIDKDPMRLGVLIARYTHGGNREIAETLEHEFGIRVWKTGNRGDWENEVRCVLSPEYREAVERNRRNSK